MSDAAERGDQGSDIPNHASPSASGPTATEPVRNRRSRRLAWHLPVGSRRAARLQDALVTLQDVFARWHETRGMLIAHPKSRSHRRRSQRVSSNCELGDSLA